MADVIQGVAMYEDQLLALHFLGATTSKYEMLRYAESSSGFSVAYQFPVHLSGDVLRTFCVMEGVAWISDYFDPVLLRWVAWTERIIEQRVNYFNACPGITFTQVKD